MLRSQIKSTARTLAVLLPIACAGLLVSRIPKAENLMLATAHADDVTSRTASLPPAYGVTLKKGQITFTRGVPKPDEGTRLLLHFEEPASEPEAVVIKDDSRHHHRVTMHGDAMIVAGGRSGNALQLGPQGGWLTIRDSPVLNLANNFLVEFCFKSDEDLPPAQEHRFLFGKYDGRDNVGYALHFRTQDQTLTAWTLHNAGSTGVRRSAFLSRVTTVAFSPSVSEISN